MSEKVTKADPFGWTIIRRYKLWSLRINAEPWRLFQSMVWLNRKGNIRSITLLTEVERAELWGLIVPQYERVVDDLIHPDRYNYEWLGNMTEVHGGHGHLHITPRYSDPRYWMGHMSVDSNPQGRYPEKPDGSRGEKLPFTKEEIIKFRDAIGHRL